jgi:hypothetical protein
MSNRIALDDRVMLVGRARAQLKLPLLSASGDAWEPETTLPCVPERIAFLKGVVKMNDEDMDVASEQERQAWDSTRPELLKKINFLESLADSSAAKWKEYRALFLCEAGPDLDIGMTVRGQTHREAVEAMREKVQKQLANLQALAEHSPATSGDAVDALLRIAKAAVMSLNYLALEKKIPAALAAATASDVWPVLASEHPAHMKLVKKVVTQLDVGARHHDRIEKKGRALLTDPAGRLTTLIRERIEAWRGAYQHLKNERWFWKGLPGWAKVLVELPDYDKDKKVLEKWWEVASELLDYSYGGQGRIRRGYLGTILKDTAGKPLSHRRAKTAIKSRLNGQAPT